MACALFFIVIVSLLCKEGAFQSYPLIAKVYLEFDEVFHVNDETGKIGLKLTMLTEWKNMLTTNEDGSQTQFDPELYLQNGETTSFVNELTENIEGGQVRQLRSIITTFRCRMDFTWLPVDTHKCSITIRSSVHNTQMLLLHWTDILKPPLAISTKNFTVVGIEQSLDEECFQSAYSTDFSCLKVTLLFLRNYSRLLNGFIIPSAVLSVIACTSLFVRNSIIRGLITTLSLFSTGGISYVTYLGLPCVACVKFLNAWTISVNGLCVACFLEFVVVQFVYKREVSGRKKYTINDLKPNFVDVVCRIVLGLLLVFIITFYLTSLYVFVTGRGQLF